jgi:hypothetical protein
MQVTCDELNYQLTASYCAPSNLVGVLWEISDPCLYDKLDSFHMGQDAPRILAEGI